MQLLNSDIAKFKKLYKEKFNIELDDHEARHKLSLLVRQMEIVYQPISVHDLEDLIIEDAKKGVLNVSALQMLDEHNKKQALKQKTKKKS
jgi:hypothetical protein